MVLSAYEYEKKVEEELKDKVRENCSHILFEKRFDTSFGTYGCMYDEDGWICLDGVEENIALWVIECIEVEKTRDSEYMFVYTDLDGNLLFGNVFFDYAMPFSDGCAYVRATRCFNGVDRFILDVKNQQILTIPFNLKDVNTIMHNNLPVLDYKTNKWGSYVINPETGTWTYGIPFIWDSLAFSREDCLKDLGVYVSVRDDICCYPNMDDTPYYRMIPGYDEVEVLKRYMTARITMSMKDAYNFDRFKYMKCKQSDDTFYSVSNPKIYWREEPLTWEKYRNTSTNDGTIVKTGDLEGFSLKKTYLKNKGK